MVLSAIELGSSFSSSLVMAGCNPEWVRASKLKGLCQVFGLQRRLGLGCRLELGRGVEGHVELRLRRCKGV